MNIPDDREYTFSHEWILLDGETILLGLTPHHSLVEGGCESLDYFQGETIEAGAVVATIRGTAGVAEVLSPVSGEVLERNDALVARPALLKEDPYGQGWMVRIRVEAGEELEHLREPSEYSAALAGGPAAGL